MNLDKAREVLIDHSRSKKNGIFPKAAQYRNQMTNPLCGDHVLIQFNIQNRKINEIGFLAKACAICSASASMMNELVQGKSIEKAVAISFQFEEGLLASAEENWPEELTALKSFEHLKINQARRTCAILPWVVLRSALKEIL